MFNLKNNLILFILGLILIGGSTTSLARSSGAVSVNPIDKLQITLPNDPCSGAWGKISKSVGKKKLTIGKITFKPKKLFLLKCNEYKDEMLATINEPIDEAKRVYREAQRIVRDKEAITEHYLRTYISQELKIGFLTWVAEIARENIIPLLPENERKNYDASSRLAQEKAQMWLQDPAQEIDTYVKAYFFTNSPRLEKAYNYYVDWMSGESRKIIKGLNKIYADAKSKLNRFIVAKNEFEQSDPKTPYAKFLKERGFSGEWIDTFKSYEGKINSLNKSYKLKEILSTMKGSFQADDPGTKIEKLFDIIDIISGVAADSNIPVVSLFGDIINSYAMVAKEMLDAVKDLGEKLRERAGYCIGEGVPTGVSGSSRYKESRQVIRQLPGAQLCPLGLEKTPWSNIYEEVEPDEGRLHFWTGKKFIKGRTGNGHKEAVQETLKLMSAARILGYSIPQYSAKSSGAVAKVYNIPFKGGVPGLLQEARNVIGGISGRIKQLKKDFDSSIGCDKQKLWDTLKEKTGLDVKPFTEEKEIEGTSRLVITYAASYVAKHGGFGKKGVSRQTAYNTYNQFWKKIKNLRLVRIYGEVRTLDNPEAPCKECQGAILDFKHKSAWEIRGCEVWKADDKGRFALHLISDDPGFSSALVANTDTASSEKLTLAASDYIDNQATIRLLIDLKEGKEQGSGGKQSQCYGLAEPGILYPVPANKIRSRDECSFIGSCRAAAQFAKKEGYQYEEECGNEQSEAKHVLRLTSVRGPLASTNKNSSVLYSQGSLGFSFSGTSTYIVSDRFASYESTDKMQTSVSVATYPKSIQLGQSFSVSAVVREQRSQDRGTCAANSRDWDNTIAVPVVISVADTKFSIDGLSAYTYPCYKDRRAGFSASYWHDRFKVGSEKSLSVNCQPSSAPMIFGKDYVSYDYVCSSANSSSEVTLTWKDDVRNDLISVGGGSSRSTITLIYSSVNDSDGDVYQAAGYEHPFNISNTWRTNTVDSGNEEERGNSGGPSAVGDESEGKPESQSTPGPSSPGIVALINEWISAAEPPSNATEGGNFRYNEWGQLIGTSASGGIATPRARPDAAGGRTSQEYMWNIRNKMDSVDLCTLGEYIKKKLAGESVSNCTSRYKPVVPKLVGQAVKTAKARLNRLKLRAIIKVGSPAPSKNLEGRVEKQGVPGQTTVARGSTVELWVYIGYVGDLVTVGNWVGKPVARAKAALKRAGVRVSIKLGSPARSATASGTVESQTPRGGMRVKKGTRVSLVIHSKFVDQVKLADLRGMPIAKASAKLKRQGMRVKIKIGSPARSAARSETVEGQTPAAGLRVVRGSEVTLKMHTRFAKTIRVPGVVGQTYRQASATINRAGLRVTRRGGSTGSKAIIKSQSPAAGMVAKAGSQVTLSVGIDETLNTPVATEVVTPQPTTRSCNIRIQGIVLQPARFGVRNEQVVKGKNISWYRCNYLYQGRQMFFEAKWFHTSPLSTDEALMKDMKKNYCDSSIPVDNRYGRGANGKALYIMFPDYLAKRIGARLMKQLVNFHLRQILPYAISCVGSSKGNAAPVLSSPARSTPLRSSTRSRPPRSPTGLVPGTWLFNVSCPSGKYPSALSFEKPDASGSFGGTFCCGGGFMSKGVVRGNRVSFVRRVSGRVQTWRGLLSADGLSITNGVLTQPGYETCSFLIKRRR